MSEENDMRAGEIRIVKVEHRNKLAMTEAQCGNGVSQESSHVALEGRDRSFSWHAGVDRITWPDTPTIWRCSLSR